MVKSWRKWLIFIACILGVVITVGSLQPLQTTTYKIDISLRSPITIVQLSDLHNAVFGEDNADLIQAIISSNPDLILITGDLLISSEDDTDIATSLISSLSSIAPVYFSYGNHELEYEERTGENIASLFTAAGATVLDESYVDITVNGTQLRIGGVYGYCLPEQYGKTTENSDELKFMREFEDTDRYKILLSHLPYSWVDYGLTADYDVDLIFTGHVHGGQIRLPFIGGLCEPEIGWFPGQCAGVYESNGTTTVLSRGLGSAGEKLPRWNNPPEVVMVKLK